MDILYLLVPISVLLVFMVGLIFWWALNNHQFEALEEAGSKLLEDTDMPSCVSNEGESAGKKQV